MPPRVTLMTAVTQPTPDLLDWVAHHRAVGVGAILVASHGIDGPTRACLDRLDAQGTLRHDPLAPPYGRTTARRAAYARLRRFPDAANADWLIALEPTEYLTIRPGRGQVEDLITAIPSAATMVLLTLRRCRGGAGLFPEGEAPGARKLPVRALVRRHHEVLFWGPHLPIATRHTNGPRPAQRIVAGDGQTLPAEIQTRSSPLWRIPPAYHGWRVAEISHAADPGTAVTRAPPPHPGVAAARTALRRALAQEPKAALA